MQAERPGASSFSLGFVTVAFAVGRGSQRPFAAKRHKMGRGPTDGVGCRVRGLCFSPAGLLSLSLSQREGFRMRSPRFHSAGTRPQIWSFTSVTPLVRSVAFRLRCRRDGGTGGVAMAMPCVGTAFTSRSTPFGPRTAPRTAEDGVKPSAPLSSSSCLPLRHFRPVADV